MKCVSIRLLVIKDTNTKEISQKKALHNQKMRLNAIQCNRGPYVDHSSKYNWENKSDRMQCWWPRHWFISKNNTWTPQNRKMPRICLTVVKFVTSFMKKILQLVREPNSRLRPHLQPSSKRHRGWYNMDGMIPQGFNTNTTILKAHDMCYKVPVLLIIVRRPFKWHREWTSHGISSRVKTNAASWVAGLAKTDHLLNFMLMVIT
jgi:hypothetical protein